MKSLFIAGLSGFAALGAQAQAPSLSRFAYAEPVVVTASRGIAPGPTLRDATVITREELDGAGALTLAEVLQRRAGVEFRATGGAGQPVGLFLRGAAAAQTLVLVDGLRVGSATIGTTSIENIPLELIERIEVVKGPLSSLYGSEAIGGVIQIFTRGKGVPHLFATAAGGNDRERRASAGLSTVDRDLSLALSAGHREVDARSATNARAFCHDPDRDPHENTYANFRAGYRLWTGERVTLEGFGSRGRTFFDGCSADDRNDQRIAGMRLTSASPFTPWWTSRLSAGQGRDRLDIHGSFPNRFETRQDQFSWVNELTAPGGTILLGYEVLQQRVTSDERFTVFSTKERDTRSFFAGLTQAWGGSRLEASWRRDDDDAFGERDTGSVSYGLEYGALGRVAVTLGHGFRAPTFFDLYGPASDFYEPNPALRPEKSRSRELAWKLPRFGAWQPRVTAFDNRVEDLITYVFPRQENVDRARIRGVEAILEGTAWGAAVRAALTVQRPRDETSGARLQGRAERFGSVDVSRRFGAWTAGLTLVASGDRYDSPSESPGSRLGGYAVVDARVRYTVNRYWSVALSATNLGDKRYETALGYDAPRRGVLASVRFEAF